MATARVLLVGLDPDIVDYSKSPVPDLTAAKVRAAVEADSAKLESLGYSVTVLYVDDGNSAEKSLADALTASRYDCIMIGAGLRVVPPYFLLFEKLINVIHRHAPSFDEALLQLKSKRYGRSCEALGLDRRLGRQSLGVPSPYTD